ncbi:hypothetical protein GCM10027592_29170 [Spirosoma flavus]
MAGLWIDDVIYKMKRKPAERMLLALICYRAAGNGGTCTDSNKELANGVGIHFQNVSEMVTKFKTEGILNVVVSQAESNARTITPISHLLIPYTENAQRYKQKTDSPISKKRRGSTSEAPTPISGSLIPSTPMTDSSSITKDEKIEEKDNENLENNNQQQNAPDVADAVDEETSDEPSDQKNEEGAPPPNPLPTADEVRVELGKSSSHWRYAYEQLKIAKSRDDYQALIEMFITQQEMDQQEDRPLFPKMYRVRNHFKNWLGKRPLINQQTNGNLTSNQANGRTKSTLRPTAVGQPNYRGTGSHCDVDL